MFETTEIRATCLSGSGRVAMPGTLALVAPAILFLQSCASQPVRRAEAQSASYIGQESVVSNPANLPGGARFDDCEGAPWCPTLVVIPSGTFVMGSPLDEAGRDADEGPQHEVRIGRFAVSKYEITFAQWDACVSDGGCDDSVQRDAGGDQGWGRGDRPVLQVGWNDARDYARWLSKKTGQRYRLLSEAEWEYAARGKTRTPFWWGENASHDYANYGAETCCDGVVSGADQWKHTAPVTAFRFPANPFGLYDMSGNVYEWVEDCWNESFDGAPTNGDAWTSGDCSKRVLRGGSWNVIPENLRVANRNPRTQGHRSSGAGIRLARKM